MTNRIALFDRWATSYDLSLLDATGFPFEGYAAVLRRLFELAEPRPGLRVLDLGTGTGALASLFAGAGCAVTGIDFSAEMLAKAREQVPQASFTRVELLGEWPSELRERSFDRVVSSYVLHEFADDKKVEMLARLGRYTLAPDGRILIGDILFSDADARSQAHREWREVWDDEEHYALISEVVPSLQAAGFTVRFEKLSFCAGVLELGS